MIGKERVQAEIDAVRQFYQLTDGLPLAVNVAAGYLAKAKLLTIKEYNMLAQDEQMRLRLLKDRVYNNIFAVFELSYQQLSSEGQHLFNSFASLTGQISV